ncbi:MAG TPA: response regulator [Acidimicrobiales bacterium]|nr:response regulator [Acidimicrobiales bacterium]
MNELTIVCVDDEPEVLEAIRRDLEPFAAWCRIETADDAADARSAIAEVVDDGDLLALVLADHRLPGETGVDLLVELAHDPATASARRVLVTGQADLADTVRAVNEAGLDHFVAKPWGHDALVAVVRNQLTDYVLAAGLDPLPYVRHLDAQRLIGSLRDRGDR